MLSYVVNPFTKKHILSTFTIITIVLNNTFQMRKKQTPKSRQIQILNGDKLF